MTHQKRPRRQRKADRLLHSESTTAEIECDYGVAPLDREALRMDEKWGIDRLPELVPPEMAAKYGLAMAHLNACIREAKPKETAAAAQNCIKGLQAMDAFAEQHGAPKADGFLFEFELEAQGSEPAFRFGVLRDAAQWRTAKANRPELVVITQREVALAVQQYLNTPLVTEAKKHFPAAEVTRIKPDPPVNYAAGGDPIPEF